MVIESQSSFGNKPASAVRPRVDPDALGEVDPDLYPDPKDATNKIRGRNDIIEFLLGDVDHELLVVKIFYFFFYSAFGSLFPLMGVYFKQMGMSASQCGLLVGCRPFVEFLSAPFWGSYADRWKKGKTLLILSLSCWIIFTLPIGYLQPPATHCLVVDNNGTCLLALPQASHLGKESVGTSKPVIIEPEVNITKIPGIGRSPVSINTSSNSSKLLLDLVSPVFTRAVYRLGDIEKSFFLMLLLVIIGEFFSAPAITLVDSAVITLLGDDADRYGHQRMFGSLGWGLSMFFLGIALDHSTEFENHPCGRPTKFEKNYKICFTAFSVLMGGALITATQIKFRYDEQEGGEQGEDEEKKPLPKSDEDDALELELAQQLNLPSLATSSSSTGTRKLPKLTATRSEQQQLPIGGNTQMFAQTIREMPEWVTVLRYFANMKCGSFLFVAWFMGFGIGLIFTFLFWHLQDFGGTPTLFGFASVINHISEICAYFYSCRLIGELGHVKVLCLGLAGNVLRFLYVSYLTNPVMVLPFELMQGITHAAVWAACCSYIAHNTPQELRSSAQGVLQGVHHGLGRGCGAVIGGLFVARYGSTATFRGYGVCCAIILGAFIFINFYRKDTGFVSDLPASEDPHQVAEDSVHLAPHGVPSNPIPRVLSSTKLHDLAPANASADPQATNLNVPGRSSKNPFLQDDDAAVQDGCEITDVTKNIEMLTRYDNRGANQLGKTSVHLQQPQNAGQLYAW